MNRLSLSDSLAPYLSEEVTSRCILGDGQSVTQHEFRLVSPLSGLTPPASSVVVDAESNPIHADVSLGVYRTSEWTHDALFEQLSAIVASVSIDARVDVEVSQPLDNAFVPEVTLTHINVSEAAFTEWLETVLGRAEALESPHVSPRGPFEYSNSLTCEACGEAAANCILRVRNDEGDGVHVGACSTCATHLSGYSYIDDENTRDTPRFN